jgi:hypothetical protein
MSRGKLALVCSKRIYSFSYSNVTFFNLYQLFDRSSSFTIRIQHMTFGIERMRQELNLLQMLSAHRRNARYTPFLEDAVHLADRSWDFRHMIQHVVSDNHIELLIVKGDLLRVNR